MTQKNNHNIVINFFNFCIKFPNVSQSNKGECDQNSPDSIKREKFMSKFIDDEQEYESPKNKSKSKKKDFLNSKLMNNTDRILALMHESPFGGADWLNSGEIFFSELIEDGEEEWRPMLIAIQDFKRSSNL